MFNVKDVLVGFLAGMLVIILPIIYWTIDRRPPYERVFGVIVPEEPAECGLPENSQKGIHAGSCVAIQWTLKRFEGLQNCRTATSQHVSRTITDANGVHVLPKTENVFGRGKKPFSETLRRPFILPDFSVPGPASYRSSACFICNPLQLVADWPVCSGDSPEVIYHVELKN